MISYKKLVPCKFRMPRIHRTKAELLNEITRLRRANEVQDIMIHQQNDLARVAGQMLKGKLDNEINFYLLQKFKTSFKRNPRTA